MILLMISIFIPLQLLVHCEVKGVSQYGSGSAYLAYMIDCFLHFMSVMSRAKKTYLKSKLKFDIMD